MRSVVMRAVLAAALVSGVLSAAPANAQSSTAWRDADACMDQADIPICLLRVANRETDGRALRFDSELAARPEILALVGLPPQAPGRVAAEHEGYPPETAPFLNALETATQLVRSGGAAEAVVAAVEQIPLSDAPVLIHPLASQAIGFGRLDAYMLLAEAISEASLTELRDRELTAALLVAWERDLGLVDEAALAITEFSGLSPGRGTLARHYARIGDNAATARVLAPLATENAPALIEALVELHLLDEAFSASEDAQPEQSHPRIRREFAAIERIVGDQPPGPTAAEIEAMRATVPPDYLEDFDQMVAEAGLLMDEQALAAEREADVVAQAVTELTTARDTLLAEARRQGRLDIAGPTARRLFDVSMAAAGDDISPNRMRAALEVLVQTEDRETAIGLVEQVASRAQSERSGGMQAFLPAVYGAWIALDEPARAVAWIETWRPLARAQGQAQLNRDDPANVLGEDGQAHATVGLQSILVSLDRFDEAAELGFLNPGAAIERDFNAGRGISLLEERLAGRTAQDQGSILISCRQRALAGEDVATAAVCVERFATIADNPVRKSLAADLLFEVAAFAARQDEVDLAVRLAELGLELGAEVELEGTPSFGSSFTFSSYLPDVAKALLRRDGRLPAEDSSSGTAD